MYLPDFEQGSSNISLKKELWRLGIMLGNLVLRDTYWSSQVEY